MKPKKPSPRSGESAAGKRKVSPTRDLAPKAPGAVRGGFAPEHTRNVPKGGKP